MSYPARAEGLVNSTTPARVNLGDMVIKGYFASPKTPASLMVTSDCLVSYLGHSFGVSYPSAEIQSVFSAAPANWAIMILFLFIVSLFLLQAFFHFCVNMSVCLIKIL